ncbi:ATP-binding protein [Thermithiobacillus plumbiphilus]|uniref:histidine kinase n=1 Tax=Thermithiobacillus plumbiphilus TaxID=1729899 RepID=A0ABU9D9Q0_9PROT
MHSLRLRLLLWLIPSVLLLWIGALGFSYVDSRREMQDVFDRYLLQIAQSLLSQGATPAALSPEIAEEIEHEDEHQLVFRVLDRAGRVISQSAGARVFPLQTPEGFSRLRVHGVQWRVLTFNEAGSQRRVLVAEPQDVRDEMLREFIWDTFMPVVLALPFLALLIWLGVGRGLKPLRELARTLKTRAPDSLAPVQLENPPAELQPLQVALNELLGRLAEAFARERRFTADAAHELRTPIAGIRLQAQVALRSTEDDARRQALRQVIQGADRATHLVAQLLTLARLEPGHVLEKAPVDLCALTEESVASLAHDAAARGTRLSLRCEAPIWVQGEAGSLGILLRNLIDNAIRYGGSQGSVEIDIRQGEPGIELSVMDAGPGIPPEERQRVLERFYRRLGTEEEGSGLGLSLVARIAAMHSASLQLGAGLNGRGLGVFIRFPG